MPNRKSQSRWLDRQRRDPYTQKAHQQHLRSRAWFKLQQIHQRLPQCFGSGTYIDLGAAPGGWSHYLAHHLPPQSRVIACDRLPMQPIPKVEWVQGDFLETATLQQLQSLFPPRSVHMVLSDLSPNLTGLSDVDQPQSLELSLQAFHWAQTALAPRGHFLVKAFAGDGSLQLQQHLKPRFRELKRMKPLASRSESRELYLFGLDYQP